MRWYRSRFFLNAEHFSRFSRLTGEWLVDAWSSVEENRLMYIRNNQHKREDDTDVIDDDIDGDGDDEFVGDRDQEPTRDVRLPSTFVHSPAWSNANIADCLALRRAYGPVTLFITFTTNPNWPEIKSQLLPSQTANDRPDLVARVFQQYLANLKKDLKKLFGPVRYTIAVKEFQKRGLPHGHIAISLADDPRTPELISKVLSCEAPRKDGPTRTAVLKHMTHKHDSSSSYHRCGWPGKGCQYGYPQPIIPESYFDERGYFHGRRRKAEDAMIVCHIPYLIAKYDAHINVEYSATVSLFQYLFKYFYKGPDEANYTVESAAKAQAAADARAASGSASTDTGTSAERPARKTVDEVRDYTRGRYLSSIEATMRIAAFNITYKEPGVTHLPIHLPGKHFGQMARNNNSQSDATMLLRYLDRPRHPRLDKMTYLEFGAQCRLMKHVPSAPHHALDVVENAHAGRPQMRIRFCQDDHRGVSRIIMVYPRHGDVYYLRALLTHCVVHSWEELRTVDGTTYATFQEAARAFGLFSNNNEATMAFRELVDFGASPGQLRWLFCVLGVEGEPVLALWEAYEEALSADVLDSFFRVTPTPDPALVRTQTLIRLQDILQGLGKNLGDLGLPEPDALQREVDSERLRWNGDPGRLCDFVHSLTADQRHIYDQVMIEVLSDCPTPIYLDGRAGRGKTYTLYPVIGAIRKCSGIILISASSAFAAKNYPGGRTAHSLYGIPVDEFNPYLQSSVGPRSERAKLLLAASVHIVDEIGALHFKAFDCADRLMRRLTGINRVWGGRFLICAGDFRQVAPVVRYGGRTAITSASLRTQAIFKKFKILTLHASIRQCTDPQFSAFLDAIGDDTENDHVDIGRLRHTTNFGEILDFVFPADIVATPALSVQRAVLSPFNQFVNEFNDAVLNRMPGELRTYYSSDSVPDDESDNPCSTPDFLNSLSEPGVPPHELSLKVGAVCRFTRNFAANRGLTKNTRVIIRRLLKYSVEVETLADTVAGQQLAAATYHIPRISTKFTVPSLSLTVIRKQLPLALSYATSFNGCQGLTVKKLGLDLRRGVFSHGQLYAAMTRVPNAQDVLILKYAENFDTVTRNVVWPHQEKPKLPY